MRITQIDTIALSRVHEPERQWFTATRRIIKADAALIRIHTDADLVGMGEATPYGGPLLIREWVAWLAQELIGRSIDEHDLLPSPTGRSVAGDFPHIHPYDAALAGLDCALWDLRAQVAGQRLVALLGNAACMQVPLYASSGVRYDWRHDPERVITEVSSYQADGYGLAKVRLGTDWSWDHVSVDRFLGVMRDLAAARGNIDLAVDGNGRLTYDQALPIARELDRLGFRWFEEPMPITDIESYVDLSKEVGMPISGGEGFTTLAQFRPYFERHALAIAQPDVACCGITEGRRIARMADRYGVRILPHNWHNGVMTLANAAFVAASTPDPMLELCMVQGPMQWAVVAEPPRIIAGQLVMPTSTGLGVTLPPNLVEQYPYIEGHYALPVIRRVD